MKIVKLHKDAERRIKAGHTWIFSNEIDTKQTPLKNYTAGELVEIETAFGNSLAIGYINPQCLLCIRVLTLQTREVINEEFFIIRLRTALAKRELIFSEPFYRLVYGDSDRMPGLVIDRFDQTIVMQINTAGMEALKTLIVAAVQLVINPETILLKCDSTERHNEGLENYTEVVQGELATSIFIKENDCDYKMPGLTGQKTGWFFDHRYSRQQISKYCKNKRVLDVFSYLGAFAIPAAKQGAKEVLCIDSSASALEMLMENAKLNHCDTIHTRTGDALTLLEELAQQKFDVIILDPPALIKKKKDIAAGTKLYQKLNEAALKLLNSGGVLFSASCSMHLSAAELLNCIRRAGIKTNRTLSVLEQCHQGPDHPIHPAIAETQYLKGYILYVE